MIAFAIALANTQIHQPDKRKNPNGEFFASLSWVVLLSKILQNCDVYVVFLQTFLLIVKLPQKKQLLLLWNLAENHPQTKPLVYIHLYTNRFEPNRRRCGRRRSTRPNGKFVSSKVAPVLSSNVHSPLGQHLNELRSGRNLPDTGSPKDPWDGFPKMLGFPNKPMGFSLPTK